MSLWKKWGCFRTVSLWRRPSGWIISNVLGVVSEVDPEDGGGYGAMGSTVVGLRVDGNNSESAVALVNHANPFMATQIVPAYMSLGTSWATNTLDWTTFQPANKDGGVFGGLDFSNRPDALVFDYKFGRYDGEAPVKASAVVYAWKGSWKQDNVPGNNSMSAEVTLATMVDRDRNILGMATSQGGEVSHSDDAELIAKTIQYISEGVNEWTTYEMPIDYLTASVPAKINVILAANDYFDSENITLGDSLCVDNVKFVYYSRLKGLTIGGQNVEGFDSDKYSYTVNGDFPDVNDVKYEVLGNSGSSNVDVVADEAAKTITLKVTNINDGGVDKDGESSHEYVISFVKELGGVVYEGNVVVDLGEPSDPIPANVHIIVDADDPSKCTIALPNFSLGEGAEIGDIIVPNVSRTLNAEGNGYEYEGSVENLTLSLAGSPIHADVRVTGTTDDKGNAKFNIPVTWLINYDYDPTSHEGIEIGVEFNGVTSTPDSPSGVNDIIIDENVPVEYYDLNGIRISEPKAGQILISRQGNKVSKIIVR